MDENLTEFQQSITKSCYKFDNATSNQLESCDDKSLNSCLDVWELNENDVGFNNLTEVLDNSKLKLRGCWKMPIKRDYCDYRSKPKPMLICYCKGDGCNSKDLPDINLLNLSIFRPNPPPNPQSHPHPSHLIFYIIPILLLLSLTLLFFYRQRNKLKKKLNCVNKSINAIKQSHLNAIEAHEPLLFKSTPKIIEHIRQGQYGNVYKGRIERQTSAEQLTLSHPGQQAMLDIDQIVAIKAYSQQMYESFKHEYNVYNLPGIQHENILKFIGCDEKRINPTTVEYWLVLEYHEYGSLYDYLKRNLVTYSQLIRICLDIATGISHLHNGKSCVVHRDLKSKNILLKSDLTACVSDFNLALVLYPNQSASENLDQVGTVRYMSPELLDCAIQFSKEGLMKIDIYAISLVFWEVMSRCSAQLGPVEPYSMPYEKELGTFLMKEQLRKHVSDNKRRPEIPEHWCDHSDLKELAKTIKELWDHDPEARLTASGIVERLKRKKYDNFLESGSC